MATFLLKVAVFYSLTFARIFAATSQDVTVKPPTCSYNHCLQANNSGVGAGSLFRALHDAHQYSSSVEIRLSADSFNLSAANNKLVTFENWTNLSLIGQGMEDTVMQCDDGVGLVFRNSSQVTLHNFSIRSCGALLETTSINMTASSDASGGVKFLASKTGVLFDSCSSLVLNEVRVHESTGMGVTIYNSRGTNLFNACNFERNSFYPQDAYPGGGGVVIETSHCVPGNTSCKDNHSELETRNSSFVFDHCTFASNRATSHYLPFDSIYPHATRHMGLGRGGGLSVIFKGHAYHNRVIVNSCDFYTNRAEWGGAMYVAFGDTSVGNSVLVNQSDFSTNNFRGGRETDRPNVTVGGALRIEMVSYPTDQELWPGYQSNVTGNSVAVRDTSFSMNFGTWGGAVSFVTTRNLPGQTLLNSLLFQGCSFTQNEAVIVAFAVDINSWKPDRIDSRESFMQPVFEDCIFDRNELLFLNITDYPVGMGAVYIIDVPTTFKGVNNFFYNSGTAMVVSETYVSVLNSSRMNFTQNHGRRGGALAFIGNSWMIAHENTSFIFDGNSVGTYGLGGAVYSVRFGEHNVFYEYNCFFRYHKFSEPPSRWNATFMFRKNVADHRPNSIYTTSSSLCVWHNSNSVPGVGAFCENSTWLFDDTMNRNCLNEIATGPKEVVVERIDIDVVPGWVTPLGVRTFNDFMNEVPSVLTATPSRKEDHDIISIANSTSYITDDGIKIYGRENGKANLLLMTLDPRVVASQVSVQVLSCPPGFRPVKCANESLAGKTCDCVCSHMPGIECNDVTRKAFLMRHHCISYGQNQSTLVVGRCPYNKLNAIEISKFKAGQLDKEVCEHYNRQGYLCSECIDGYGVTINKYTYSCAECKGREKYNWLLFLLLEIGPITLACFLVILFSVSVTSPSMNAFIFFSQIVSVSFNTNTHAWFFGVERINKDLEDPIVFLYGVWNLEFFKGVFPGICLNESLKTLDILVINYVKALYPMILLALCYVCIKMYDANFRVLHFMWKPFRYCRKSIYKTNQPKTSIIDAFATLIVLSYSKFIYVSFPLVSLISIYEIGDDATTTAPQKLNYRYYFDPDEVLHHSMPNFIYFILGILVLFIFVGLPPLFLILYPLQFTQSCISKLNVRVQITLRTFADTFLGGFRDGTNGKLDCRWFAGLYLILRVIVLIVFSSIAKWDTQYLVQQVICILAILLFALVRPYKEEFYNYLDTTAFTLVAIINALSAYNFSQFSVSNKDIDITAFCFNYVLIFLPLVYLIVLVIYHVLRWWGFSCVCSRWRKESVRYEVVASDSGQSSEEIRSTYSSSSELPDRFIHPQDYNTLKGFPSSLPTIHEHSPPGGGGRGSGRVARTDVSPLLAGAGENRAQLAGGGYGSVQGADQYHAATA